MDSDFKWAVNVCVSLSFAWGLYYNGTQFAINDSYSPHLDHTEQSCHIRPQRLTRDSCNKSDPCLLRILLTRFKCSGLVHFLIIISLSFAMTSIKVYVCFFYNVYIFIF